MCVSDRLLVITGMTFFVWSCEYTQSKPLPQVFAFLELFLMKRRLRHARHNSGDIIEPMTYFWGQSFMLLCFAYFIRSNREWGFAGVRQGMVEAKARRRYAKDGFDASEYEKDVEVIELWRQRIRDLEKGRI